MDRGPDLPRGDGGGLDALFANPYMSVGRAEKILKITNPTARQAVRTLLEHGLLEEITGRAWGRLYLARPILRAIEGSEGTRQVGKREKEPPSRLQKPGPDDTV